MAERLDPSLHYTPMGEAIRFQYNLSEKTYLIEWIQKDAEPMNFKIVTENHDKTSLLIVIDEIIVERKKQEEQI